MAKKKKEEQPQDTNGWITTYTDLCTLLLTFFVLLLTMSTIDNERQRKALDSLVGAFGLMPGGRSPIGKTKGKDMLDPTSPIVPTQAVDFEMLKEITMKNRLDPDLVRTEKDQTVIEIGSKVLFLPGSAVLRPSVHSYLSQLASYMDRAGKAIEIRGHTDRLEELDDLDWPEQSWELSAKRAMAVYKFFDNKGINTSKMGAHGFSYFQPRVDSLAYPDLRERNRRVEIALGPSHTIPAELTRYTPKPGRYINYKNFLFNLFPPAEARQTPPPQAK